MRNWCYKENESKMSNITNNILAILAISICCSYGNADDMQTPIETSQTAPFFNLNVGNKWVYKRCYNSHEHPEILTFTGQIDSVKADAVVNINGNEYSKLSHKNGSQIRYEYLRVNDAGHLVGFRDREYLPDNENFSDEI